MNVTVSETLREKPISWVTTTMVMPPFARSAMRARTPLTSSGSRAEVASSKNMTSGFMARARAIATRCCWPPERVAGRTSALCLSPTRSSWLRASWRACSLGSFRSLRRANATFSPTLLCGNRLNCWKTMPILRRSSSGFSFRTDLPSRRMSPASGSISRFITRRRVDFPEPDGPITDAVVPAGTLRSMPRRTLLCPKARWTLFASREPDVNWLMSGLPSRRRRQPRPVPSSAAGRCAGVRRSS
jgi:hypothetical protein